MTSIVEFRMPKFGELMEKGKVVAWKKSVGEKIDKGESIVEIETDKSNLDVESPVSGIIVEILIPEGSTEEINTVLARISTTDK
jgi:pyruvate/2-oxoglutarate dehydrogenase complex dihydrolipoamide acyltransferase (E2) component